MGSPPEMKLWAVQVLVLCGLAAVRATNTTQRAGKSFSLFSIVQFPNQQCTSSSSSSTYGTCFTSSECTSKGGSADGNRAAGFGVCCVIYTTTCGSSLSTNTTYIRNPNYPSSYTPSTTGTCAFTFNKVSDDVCQLRLDFQTFSGFATTTPIGACSDYMTAAGQTLAGHRYNNCIRTEKGYCAIQWEESSTTSPDPFSLDSISVVGSNGVGPPAPAVLCDTAYIAIPNLSPDGVVGIPMPVGLYQSWQSQVCGSNFGIEGMGVASVLVSRQQPFVLGVYTVAPGTAVSPSATTGFNLDYTQLPC